MLIPAAAIKPEILEFVTKYGKTGDFFGGDECLAYEKFDLDSEYDGYRVVYVERGNRKTLFRSGNIVEAVVFLLAQMKRTGIVDYSDLER
ncbi:MAG: hypothetical protein O9322_12680 [Beijerinckiaceae bacterium]|nr:hypothetical protein [Beijerinckiaceae bacterium]MCZ8300196.1 hypothetical protein [Beijerinckiaceae bacterium]